MKLDGTSSRIYAVYTFVKFLAASIVLYVVAHQEYNKMEAHATVATCTVCLAASKVNPKIDYEFEFCQRLLPANPEFYKQDNLLVEEAWFTFTKSSPVDGYRPLSSVTLGFCIFTSLLFCFLVQLSDALKLQLSTVVKGIMHLNFICIVLLVITADQIWMFGLHSACYIANVNPTFMVIVEGIAAAYMFLWILFFWLQKRILGLVVFSVFILLCLLSLAMGVLAILNNGQFYHFVFVLTVALTILEVPLIVGSDFLLLIGISTQEAHDKRQYKKQEASVDEVQDLMAPPPDSDDERP